MVVDNLFSVSHATVADLDGIAAEDFSEFVPKENRQTQRQ